MSGYDVTHDRGGARMAAQREREALTPREQLDQLIGLADLETRGLATALAKLRDADDPAAWDTAHGDLDLSDEHRYPSRDARGAAMTSRLDELHDSVVKNPEDDAPRLAYADACENVDGPRAELIRAQIAETRALRDGRRDSAREAFKRWFSLERRFHDKWGEPVRDRVKAFGFYRGFIEWVHVDARRFLDDADELYALAPIRRLSLAGVVPLLDRICASPHVSRIVTLDLGGERIGDDGVVTLASSPHFRNLVKLDLSGTGITARGVEALARSQTLPSLREVLGLPKEFQEEVWTDPMNSNADQFQIAGVAPPRDAPVIEQRFGRKPWLHPYEDSEWRLIDDASL